VYAAVGLVRPWHGLESNPILDLQRAAGNRAVQRLFEENAKAVRGDSVNAEPARFGHDLSRVPTHTGAAASMQTKLAVNRPGDAHEQEADRVADKVLGMTETPSRRACACGGECPKCSSQHGEGERIQTKPARAHDTAAAAAAPRSVEEALSSRGRPLDSAAREFFEPRFGRDFSHVRVHTDASAAESARDVNARAYTLGSQIVFGQGEYAPGTSEGARLLAHELTHVIQQGAQGRALIQRETPAGSTNYAFDTYRVTGAHLSDPDVVARFKALSFEGLLDYRRRISDPDVIAFVEQLLDERMREQTLDQLSAALAAEKDQAVKNFLAEWISAHAPTSYEFALGSNKPGTTATALTPNGISLKILPDEYVERAEFDSIVARLSAGKGSAHTGSITVFDPKWQPHWVSTAGKVTRVRPTTQKLTIKTVWPRGASRVDPSGYGVGTRADADVKTGRSTLAHHEGEHAACFVRYVTGTAPPVFTGSVGDTDAQVNVKAQTFQTAMEKYYADMVALCGPSVDCTGTKAPFCP
jgi:hypothetical protein